MKNENPCPARAEWILPGPSACFNDDFLKLPGLPRTCTFSTLVYPPKDRYNEPVCETFRPSNTSKSLIFALPRSGAWSGRTGPLTEAIREVL